MAANFIDLFRAAWRVSTPLIAARTPDPAATVNCIVNVQTKTTTLRTFDNPPVEPPVFLWDMVRGLVALNEKATPIVKQLNSNAGGKPDALAHPVEMLVAAQSLPKFSILFMSNAHRDMSNPQYVQGLWNLRDAFKMNTRTIILLCPAITLPPELAQDVLILDEPLPNEEQLANIVRETFEAANLQAPKAEVLSRCVDALCGLAAFPAEQVCAMSISKNGMDENALWERKRLQIEQTPGLSVWRGGERFTDIGGCSNVKEFLTRIIKGKNRPRAIVFQDEIEKALAGAAGDMSGTTQELLGSQLSFMQDHKSTGLLFIGHPGAAKSAIAKATGNEAGIPTIQFDLGGMKGSLVGESNANMRTALKVVEAVSQGRALFIATCNDITALPPELRRRFSFGTFFFDLPPAKVRDNIWKIYLKKLEIKDKERPADGGWTGAEIENCCNIAWRLDTTLEDASSYIVPLVTSAKERIDKLRREADTRFISAEHPGPYKAPEGIEETESDIVVAVGRIPAPGRRKINTGDKDAN